MRLSGGSPGQARPGQAGPATSCLYMEVGCKTVEPPRYQQPTLGPTSAVKTSQTKHSAQSVSHQSTVIRQSSRQTSLDQLQKCKDIKLDLTNGNVTEKS